MVGGSNRKVAVVVMVMLIVELPIEPMLYIEIWIYICICCIPWCGCVCKYDGVVKYYTIIIQKVELQAETRGSNGHSWRLKV